MLSLTELLTTPSTQLGRASRFIVFQIKLWTHCARLLRLNRAGQQAAALSYHTIFGIVPLAIVMLMIFQSFPAYSYIGDRVKNFIYEQANFTAFKSPAQSSDNTEETINLTEHLDAIVARFFTETNKGQIGLFSILIVIWAALALLATIEKSFNNIWHVTTGRNFLHRIISYWALLTLGPLILGAGIYMITRYSQFVKLQETLLSYVTPPILSFFVAMVTFFLFYFILPNTKVHFKAAIWGAAVAALVWMTAKGVFGYCITELGLYRTVYGVMALIPMTVVWIYITWLTVLFGLQLTYTTQHLHTLDAAEIASAKKTEHYFVANDLTAINIVREIALVFEKNQAPIEAEVLCSELNIPAEFADKILTHFVNRGIIVRTAEPKAGFMPARDPENIKLSDISEALADIGFAQSAIEQLPAMQQISQSRRNALAQYSLKQILDIEQNG
ncbi:MAG: YihY family inner membrane protein [Sedimentisphaerales bacterium]|nr:YihY family inner membrane protein [Sedimentisphaerales bacterium]